VRRFLAPQASSPLFKCVTTITIVAVAASASIQISYCKYFRRFFPYWNSLSRRTPTMQAHLFFYVRIFFLFFKKDYRFLTGSAGASFFFFVKKRPSLFWLGLQAPSTQSQDIPRRTLAPQALWLPWIKLPSQGLLSLYLHLGDNFTYCYKPTSNFVVKTGTYAYTNERARTKLTSSSLKEAGSRRRKSTFRRNVPERVFSMRRQ